MTEEEKQTTNEQEPAAKAPSDKKDSIINKPKSPEPKGEAIDDYAEVPEEVLDEEELQELEEVKKETEERVNGTAGETKSEGIKPQQRGRYQRKDPKEILRETIAAWDPKTKLGQEVKDGKIKNIDEILNSGRKILESEIVDSLLNLKSELISIGQSKGKFGGGKRRAWRQTQRKTKEGNVPSFSTMAVVGDENGHLGIGDGKAKETLPARDKAIRKAKLNIMHVTRACAGFDCTCSEPHSVPFKVTGKAGSVTVTLIPAAQGTGLVVASELKKILSLAGIKDVYSRTSGKKRTTFNLIKACIDALEKTNARRKG
ncbi:MAG: 30S ribosomal protein S5 [archaeon]